MECRAFFRPGKLGNDTSVTTAGGASDGSMGCVRRPCWPIQFHRASDWFHGRPDLLVRASRIGRQIACDRFRPKGSDSHSSWVANDLIWRLEINRSTFRSNSLLRSFRIVEAVLSIMATQYCAVDLTPVCPKHAMCLRVNRFWRQRAESLA